MKIEVFEFADYRSVFRLNFFPNFEDEDNRSQLNSETQMKTWHSLSPIVFFLFLFSFFVFLSLFFFVFKPNCNRRK